MAAHDVPASVQLLGVAITAGATIIVAWVTTLRGRKAARQEDQYSPAEHSQHDHTRDLIRTGFAEINRRLDALLFARGLQREQEQLERSRQNLLKKDDE